MIQWHEESRSVKDLRDHEHNPRQFTEKGMKELADSIRSIGYAQPININTGSRESVILSGHARKKILLDAGLETVIVWVPDRELTEKEEREVLLRMNKNTAGEFNFEILANEYEIEELKEVGFTDFDLSISPIKGDPAGREFDETIAEGIDLCKCERCGHQHARRG